CAARRDRRSHSDWAPRGRRRRAPPRRPPSPPEPCESRGEHTNLSRARVIKDRMRVPSSLKQAARRLLKDWRFTLTATVTLTVALAANTVVFGAAYTVLLRPLPMANGPRLYVLWNAVRDRPGHMAIAAPEFLEYRERLRAVDGIAAIRDRAVNLTGAAEPRKLAAILAAPDLGRILGIRPELGRDFDAKDADTRVALISHRLWTQTFGGDASTVGRAIRLDGSAYAILCVPPRSLTVRAPATFH